MLITKSSRLDRVHFRQPWYQGHGSGRVCFVAGHTSSFSGPSRQALTLLGGVRYIAWILRWPFLQECRRVPRHFWECWTRLAYDPAVGPTLKKALCHTHHFGGTEDKYRWLLSRKLFKLDEPDMQDIAGEAEMNS